MADIYSWLPQAKAFLLFLLAGICFSLIFDTKWSELVDINCETMLNIFFLKCGIKTSLHSKVKYITKVFY